MNMRITYCWPCGYGKLARELADAVQQQHEHRPQLIVGFPGAFRVEANGRVIYDKRRTRGWLGWLGFGRVPTAQEVLSLLEEQSAAEAPA